MRRGSFAEGEHRAMAVNIIGLGLIVAAVILMIMGGLVAWIIGVICLIGATGAKHSCSQRYVRTSRRRCASSPSARPVSDVGARARGGRAGGRAELRLKTPDADVSLARGMTRPALRSKLLSLAILGGIVTAAPGATAGDLSDLTAPCNWRQVLSIPGGWFSDVAVARGSVWAVGYQTPRGSNKTYPLISEWNGQRWSTTVGKGFGKHWGALAGVNGDLWVTGVRNRKPVLHHFAGQRWTTEFRDVTFGESQGSDAIWMREGQ